MTSHQRQGDEQNVEGMVRERETNVLYLVVPLTSEGGRIERERDQCAILGSTPDK